MCEEKKTCACSGAVKLIFPCSGAADVGEISDRAARNMSAAGKGKMYCLAGIGGNVSGIVETAKGADTILALDGCQLDCAAKSLQGRGITRFLHKRVTDMGLEKGKSPVCEERIAVVIEKCVEALS